MLKAMRKHAKFFYILFFMVIISFVFWGVGTVDKSTGVPVAEIGKEKISVEEYWTAYDRTRAFYRNISQGNFTDEMEKKLNLKQRVLDSLIDERVLLLEAKKTGILVTEQELEDAIVNDPAFMRDGRFSKDVYVRTLQLNRMTPESYESLKKRELTYVKMRRIIGEAVDVADETLGKQVTPDLRQALLSDLRERAVKSYIEGLKKQVKIKINEQLIS